MTMIPFTGRHKARLAAVLCALLLQSACSDRDAALAEKLQRAEQAAQRAEAAQAKAETAANKAVTFSGRNQSTADAASRSDRDKNSGSQDSGTAGFDPVPDNPNS